MSLMNKEYLTVAELLAASTPDRNLFISALDSLFKGKNFFAPVPFENLEKVTQKIYDSYLPKSGTQSETELDFTDFSRIKSITKNYFR